MTPPERNIPGGALLVSMGAPDEGAQKAAEHLLRCLNLEATWLQFPLPKMPAARRRRPDEESSTPERAETVTERTGHPVGPVLEKLRSGGYSMVVVGMEHHPAAQPAPSWAVQIALRSPVTTLVLQGSEQVLRSILVCTGGKDASERPLRWGLRLARTANAALTIMHVSSRAPGMYAGLPAFGDSLMEVLARDTPLSRHLKDAARLCEKAGVQAQIALRYGIVADEIVRACEVEGHDLVIVGASLDMPMEHVLIDDVLPTLLVSIRTPLLIARQDPPHGDE